MIERSKCMNVPEIRFNDSLSEWSKKNFLSEVSIYSGLTYSPNDIRTQGTLVLRSSNVQEGNVSLNDNVYVNSFIVNSPNVQKGDIIIVVRNGSQSLIGKHAIIKQEMPNTVIGAFMTGLHCKNNSNFINALLSSTKFKKEIYKNLGATINQITNKTLTSMEFMFPKENDMYNIGCFFEKLDSLIQSTSKKLVSLKQVKAASLQSMFPQEGETVPKVRFKGFEGEWSLKYVFELLCERNELSPQSPEFPLMAFIANNGIAEKGERYDRSALVNDVINKQYKRTYYGDFIYSSNNLETGSIGLNTYGKATISPVYSIFYCTLNSDSNFVGYCMTRKSFIKEMIKWRQGVMYGQWRIHEKDFLRIKVLIPSLPEQQKIGTYFRNIDRQISLQTQRLEKLKQIKAACLDKMFV